MADGDNPIEETSGLTTEQVTAIVEDRLGRDRRNTEKMFGVKNQEELRGLAANFLADKGSATGKVSEVEKERDRLSQALNSEKITGAVKDAAYAKGVGADKFATFMRLVDTSSIKFEGDSILGAQEAVDAVLADTDLSGAFTGQTARRQSPADRGNPAGAGLTTDPNSMMNKQIAKLFGR